MKKIDALSQVAEFHKLFGHPIEGSPKMPSKALANLRIDLLEEELEELKTAIHNNDMVEVADALCDIQYVLAGAILVFGLGDKFKTLFDEVHRANMSKACNSQQEAQQTIEFYRQEKNTDAYYVKKNNKYLVYRKKDNKTLKSIHYDKEKLKPILN